jgi:hypothetical protein
MANAASAVSIAMRQNLSDLARKGAATLGEAPMLLRSESQTACLRNLGPLTCGERDSSVGFNDASRRAVDRTPIGVNKQRRCDTNQKYENRPNHQENNVGGCKLFNRLSPSRK